MKLSDLKTFSRKRTELPLVRQVMTWQLLNIFNFPSNQQANGWNLDTVGGSNRTMIPNTYQDWFWNGYNKLMLAYYYYYCCYCGICVSFYFHFCKKTKNLLSLISCLISFRIHLSSYCNLVKPSHWSVLLAVLNHLKWVGGYIRTLYFIKKKNRKKPQIIMTCNKQKKRNIIITMLCLWVLKMTFFG